MKYCSIHGPAGDTDSCPHKTRWGVTCNTATTDQPNARWAAILASQKPPQSALQSDETPQPNARALNRRQGAFLAAYEKCGRIGEAAEAAGIDRSSHYTWLRGDTDYKAAFQESDIIVGQNVLDEAVRRAVQGWDEPVTVAGQREVVRKFSDRLLERLLEAHHPEKFRSNLAHRLVDKDGKDRKLLDYQELDALVKAADARDKEQS